jgi:hypothetical protein
MRAATTRHLELTVGRVETTARSFRLRWSGGCPAEHHCLDLKIREIYHIDGYIAFRPEMLLRIVFAGTVLSFQ